MANTTRENFTDEQWARLQEASGLWDHCPICDGTPCECEEILADCGCKHDRLDQDGICRACGEDCRRGT